MHQLSSPLAEEEEDSRSSSNKGEVETRRSDPRNSQMLLLSAGVLLIQGLWCLGALDGEGPFLGTLPEIRAPLQTLAAPNASFREIPSGDILDSLQPGRDAVLLLYAPWDRKQTLKGMQVLQRLRSIFPEDLTLSAVNCWNLKGPCYNRYFQETLSPSKRILSYPQWLYVPKNRPLKDPFKNARFFNADFEEASYEHILSFLMRQRHPIRVWKTHQEWIEDRALFGGLCLTGYFPSLEDMREYIRSAEMIASLDSKDNILPVGVVLNKELAERLGLKRVKLFWWNGSLEYPRRSSLNRTLLVSWAKKTLVDSSRGQKYLVPELMTSSSKSFLMDTWLNSGYRTSLLAFLKPELGGGHLKGLFALRESALLYLSSATDFEQNKSGVKDLYETFVKLRVSEDEKLFKEEATCKNAFSGELRSVNPCPHSLYHNESLHDEYVRKRVYGDEASVRQSILSHRKSICLHLAHKELDNGCFGHTSKASNDLLGNSMKEELLGIHSGNKSLSFYFMDSESNGQLMVQMGLDPKANQVLIDSLSEERRWKMQATPFGPKSLSQFVWDWHYARDSLSVFRKSKVSLETCDSSADLCIPEISASNFVEVVLKSTSRYVVLLHQTQSCYFCASARRSLHALKRFLEPVDFGTEIIFVTIDGGANDLPAAHTAPVYPSLVLYPAGDKSRSKVYPLGEPFTMQNVKKFILGNLRPDEVIRIEAHVCGASCLRAKEAQLRSALSQTSESLQREFSSEFEEMRRLLSMVNSNLLSKKDDIKTRYEFIKSFRILLDGLYE